MIGPRQTAPCGRWTAIAGGLAPAALILMALLLAAPASAQSGGDFEITRSTLDAGGSTERSIDEFWLRGTIGQPDVGNVGFGQIWVTGGFWATQGRTGIFFADGFESGDTSAWFATIGAAFLTPDEPPPAGLGAPPAPAAPNAARSTVADADEGQPGETR